MVRCAMRRFPTWPVPAAYRRCGERYPVSTALARKITTIGDSRSDNRCAPVDSITRSAEADLAQNVFPVLQLPPAL